MAIGRTNSGGAGGGGLNFKVVQYTSTPTGTAKENTIAVVTDTAISGWVMQAEQPTGTAGLVWIEVGASSEVAFFADKKGMVKLYPAAVKQYVGKAWVNRDAYIYQNDAWVQFSREIVYIIKDGVEMVSLEKIGQVSDGDGCIKVDSSCRIFTNNPIDFSGLTTLYIHGYFRLTSASGAVKCVFGLNSTLPESSNGSMTLDTAGITPKPDSSGEQTYTIDCTNITGTYYVVYAMGYSSTYRVNDIYSIWGD